VNVRFLTIAEQEIDAHIIGSERTEGSGLDFLNEIDRLSAESALFHWLL
jgi:hypothetical protein